MDGYEKLVKTKTWAALKAAQAACFDVQVALSNDGIIDCGEEFQAMVDLCQLENRLRTHFKESS